ncbi:MAG: ATP-binding cassette domain-containing protein, partial [Defluviitaleaceae bacterium]|nr:ATP-binding cassette domain-containing protein [Defluviitaleaceae bacterium]
MERYTKDKVRTYSLGMRQRVGLAAALLSRPRLLILDEPANGLDIEGMIYVRDVVRTAAEDGSTVLISSHLAGEIQQYATRAAVMHNGRLLATDTLSNILTNHETLENYLVTQVQNYRKNQ